MIVGITQATLEDLPSFGRSSGPMRPQPRAAELARLLMFPASADDFEGRL